MKILVVELTTGDGLDLAGELAAALGNGIEIELLRGADRQKLDMALSHTQYDAVHIAGHGTRSVLNCMDGLMPEAEFTTMIEAQKNLRFVLLSACDSYDMAAAVHNAIHVPVIAYAQPIEDRAAVEFARGFYRSWKKQSDIAQAVARGTEALAVLYPSEAHKVRLIDGDMASLSAIANLHEEMVRSFTVLNQRMDQLESEMNSLNGKQNYRMQIVIAALLAALLVAQVLTPVLSLWLSQP